MTLNLKESALRYLARGCRSSRWARTKDRSSRAGRSFRPGDRALTGFYKTGYLLGPGAHRRRWRYLAGQARHRSPPKPLFTYRGAHEDAVTPATPDKFSLAPSAGRGRPAARPRACATATATIACQSVAAWPCRHDGGAWRPISGVGREISRASTSAPSSSICSATCAVPSTCCGIAAPSIDVARSVRSWPIIAAFTSTTSPRTPPSSIRPSTCGPGRTTNSPMASRTISVNSALG
jgi:hypothetical protein